MTNYGRRDWLRDKRTAHGFTQAEVARMLCITCAYYQLIESGRRNPSAPLARKIAVLFDFPMERLFEASGQ